MEEFLSQLISTNNTVGLIAAAVVFVIITLQRNNTKKTRDDSADRFETRISLLEREIADLKALNLEAKLAQILTDLQWLKEKLK